MKGCWSGVQLMDSLFTHIAALLTEFSVICALLMKKKNFFHAEMANQMKTETSSISNSTSSKRR